MLFYLYYYCSVDWKKWSPVHSEGKVVLFIAAVLNVRSKDGIAIWVQVRAT